MSKEGYVYILTNRYHTVFYTGVTSDIHRRMYEHTHKQAATSFTARYNLSKLIYLESYFDVEEAIRREKQIKGYSRAKKLALITKTNPGWQELKTVR